MNDGIVSAGTVRRPELARHLSVALDDWLAQFDSDGDREVALKLFEAIRFFSLENLRESLRGLHRWLLSQPGFNVRATRFTSFAEGKSGGLIQYFYRTSNYLHHTLGVDWTSLASPPPLPRWDEPETLVIVDDFIGSGREAEWYFTDAREALKRWPRKYFLALVGFDEGISFLGKTHPEVTVRCLEAHQKLFDEAHSGFTAEEKERIADLCRRYGNRVYPPERYGKIASPFGYRDGQALVAFFYNTPSNTLPIFWSVENGWQPLFKRYDTYNVPDGEPRCE